MSLEPVLMLVRAAHLLAAAAWVGGAIAYAVSGGPPSGGPRPFSWLVGVSAWILLLSGLVLTADRLSGAPVGVYYVGLLALKLALAIAMFLAAGALAPSAVARLGRRGGVAVTPRRGLPHLVLTLGVGVYLLGATLAVAYTAELVGSRW